MWKAILSVALSTGTLAQSDHFSAGTHTVNAELSNQVVEGNQYEVNRVDANNFKIKAPENYTFLKDFVSETFTNESNENTIKNIREFGEQAGGLTNYAVWRSAVARKAQVEAKLRLENAKSAVLTAKHKANRSRTEYHKLRVALSNYVAAHGSAVHHSESTTNISKLRLAKTTTAVADLRMRIEAAQNVEGSMEHLEAIITADDQFQLEIATEIKHLQERARVSRANASAARSKRDGNTQSLYNLQMSLRSAMSAHNAAQSAYALISSNSNTSISAAEAKLRKWQLRVDSAQRISETDVNDVAVAISFVRAAEADLRSRISEAKQSVEDAAHAAWHRKDVDTVSGAHNSAEYRSGHTQTDVINAGWAKIRSTKALVAQLTQQLSDSKSQATNWWEQYRSFVEVVKVQLKKAQIDIHFSKSDQAACRARNAAALTENQSRLAGALDTARWVCQDQLRCQWQYDDVALAEEEDCNDEDAGDNHKQLAADARQKAQAAKVKAGEFDQLVAEFTIKLDDARVRYQQAYDARVSGDSETLPEEVTTNISQSALEAAQNALSNFRTISNDIAAQTTSHIMNDTEVKVMLASTHAHN